MGVSEEIWLALLSPFGYANRKGASPSRIYMQLTMQALAIRMAAAIYIVGTA